jgi:hypothetical protein
MPKLRLLITRHFFVFTTNLQRLSATENWLITPPELASVSPINPWSDMRENASIVSSLLTRSRDSSPLLRHLSVYSCCLATNEARQCNTICHSSRLGSEKTPLRLLLRNRGSVFQCYGSCMAYTLHNIFTVTQYNTLSYTLFRYVFGPKLIVIRRE